MVHIVKKKPIKKKSPSYMEYEYDVDPRVVVDEVCMYMRFITCILTQRTTGTR